MARADVVVQIATCDDNIPGEADFLQWVQTALPAGDPRDFEVTVRVVGVAEGQRLNQQYRNRDYATNVLSFPAELPPELELPLLGDLVLCSAVIEAEAREQNKTLRAHWAHLTIHGTLHLLGFDHETEAEAEEMEALETELLQRLEFPAPYGG